MNERKKVIYKKVQKFEIQKILKYNFVIEVIEVIVIEGNYYEQFKCENEKENMFHNSYEPARPLQLWEVWITLHY